jgi:hypothetical protein
MKPSARLYHSVGCHCQVVICRQCDRGNVYCAGDCAEQARKASLHRAGLPDNPYPADERLEVSVGKTPYIRFDLNDYSVPHTQVRRTVTVMASLTHVRVLDGSAVIAEHPRVYGKGEQIEHPARIDALVAGALRPTQHRHRHHK